MLSPVLSTSHFGLATKQMLRNYKSSFVHSLCLRILFWDIRIVSFVSFFLFCHQCLCNFVGQKWRALTRRTNPSSPEPLKHIEGQKWRALTRRTNPSSPEPLKHIEGGVRVSKEEVIGVMEKLGIGVELDGDGIEVFGEQQVSDLFEEEPSLAEVKAAFDVFDENKDGFIEARELQRVLRCLGLQRDLQECKQMINAVDRNGDELVDDSDFVKLLERCFSCSDS